MEKVLQAFNEIAGYLPKLDRLKATFGAVADFEQSLGLIYSDIIEFHRRAYKFFRRKAWHIWFAFDWGLFERRFKSILGKLHSHCDLLDREAAAIHFSEMKNMRDKRELDEEVFEQHRSRQLIRDVFFWLSGDEDDSQEECLHRISDNRQPGTCDWVLEEPLVRSWIEDDKGESVIWMTGIPGAGKSFLCSLIIQNLETHRDLTEGYYFCSHSNGDTCATILRILAVQILRSHLDVAELVHQAYLQKGSSRSYPAMKRMLKEILSTVPNTRIVLDGLDEGDQKMQQETLKTLLELQKHAGHNCKLLISSREEPSIGKTIPYRIHLKLDDKTTQGLNIFIQHKVGELKIHFPELDTTLLTRVNDRLQAHAKGMFLWVRLVHDMLLQQSSEFEIEQAIKRLPDGLDEAYWRILSRFLELGPDLKNRVFKILLWVSAVERSVSIHEIADGIALNSNQLTLSKKTKCMDGQRDILDICAPLLEISKNREVNLVHFSAKEYLLHDQSGPFVDIAQAHFNIAYSCIANLTATLVVVPRHRNGVSDFDLETQIVQGDFGLQPYGHQFWAEHVLAYLEKSSGLAPQTESLLVALEKFSKVCKAQPPGCIEPAHRLNSGPNSRGLDKLRANPLLFNFISGWLRFKSKAQDSESTIDDFHAQEDWRLQADETHLSLIDFKIREISERLLAMTASSLPPHISMADHQAFVNRTNFGCRFFDCTRYFDSLGDRDAHEHTHSRSFPCLQCDWGFKSRKDLEKHTRKYHMFAEDFEIPDCLPDATIDSKSTTGTSFGRNFDSADRKSCWNKHGRAVLQKGFWHVLAKFASGPTPVSRASNKVSSIHLNHTNQEIFLGAFSGSHGEISAVNVASIRAKVENKQYETFADFKDDIQELSKNLTTTREFEAWEDIAGICDQEFEDATSNFPAFANFDLCKSRLDLDMTNPKSITNLPLSSLGQTNDNEAASSIGKRKPYWSKTEVEQFPELLDQCGRDFITIAGRLKTKTINDIDQYLKAKPELLRLAEEADARLQQIFEAILPIQIENDDEPHKLPLIESEDPRPAALTYSAEALEAMLLSRKRQQEASADREAQSNMHTGNRISHVTNEDSKKLAIPKSTRRRPRPRAACPKCNIHKNGLRDEYALERHLNRLHNPTRRVWVCDDVSMDKKFLAKCKPCSAGKRYKSRHNGSKHLRDFHFGANASHSLLTRWMREMEEPNSNFMADDITTPSIFPQKAKYEEQNGIPQLRDRPNSSNSSDLLPSMLLTSPSKISPSSQSASHSVTPGSRDSADDQGNEEPSEPIDGEAPGLIKRTLLLPNVSFDHLLAGPATSSQYDTGPKHRTNLALVKPEQVRRLPHLDPFPRLAYQDQVEGLHNILDHEVEGSKRYEGALEDLTDVSRTLLQGLMQWRQQSTLAPTIPFSI